VTRVRTLSAATDGTSSVYDTACELYRALELDQPRVRLVGVKAENLQPAAQTPQQLTLDLGGRPAHLPADQVVDQARARFGAGAIGYGSLMSRDDDPAPGARKS
jgi:DNA polymerase-4